MTLTSNDFVLHVVRKVWMIIFDKNKNKVQCFSNTLVMQQENETRAIAILRYPSVVQMQGYVANLQRPKCEMGYVYL
jgi:hypothetical protein